jgi:hypothetical protein
MSRRQLATCLPVDVRKGLIQSIERSRHRAEVAASEAEDPYSRKANS